MRLGRGIALGRKRNDSLLVGVFETLKFAPVWVGPMLAGVAFVFFRWISPWMLSSKTGELDLLWGVRAALPNIAWIASGMIILAWIAAEIY